MYREAMNELIKWKNSTSRLPLIIRGARQVGKTWLMKEFGKTNFKKYAYINFENNESMAKLFEGNFDIQRIITGFKIESNCDIEAKDTLIILDEIQEVPSALTSLKYFTENAGEYFIIAAGSLLGMARHEGKSFPVGKVSFLDLYPLNFKEFLLALGKENYVEMLEKQDWSLIKSFHNQMIDLLKQYYFVGGMPACVNEFSNKYDYNEVRKIQEEILRSYEQDFSKHPPSSLIPRLRQLWNSIPGQLAKENRKFIYKLIRNGARAREYETSIMWLNDCGLIHKVNRVVKPIIPLKAYEDIQAFKIFLIDIGLLCAMNKLESKTLISGNALFDEYKGALTEQYVLEQLACIKDLSIYYWTSERSSAEVDFVIDYKNEVIPVEVKASENLQAKSLKVYNQLYNPKISIRTSMSKYRKESWLINIPLYAISWLDKNI
jgi:predicted AAA+ superfamily ATPase